MRWVFIGSGNMASSLIGGLIGSGGNAADIAVVDPSSAACEKAQRLFGIRSGATLADVLPLNDVATASAADDTPLGIVLAVKPHVVEPVCRACTALYNSGNSGNPGNHSVSNTLFVSVAAGVRASSMEQWLPADAALVRCMPNTPALLGLGATVLFANPSCSEQHKEQAQALMQSAGMTEWVENEALLDAVTALSGSGPAYFFYLIEQMSKAAQTLGMNEKMARDLAIETAFGAASMARAKEHPPAVLRENVTSKGGTTAAALQVFDEQGLPATVLNAMQAAHDRAVELGDQLASD